MVVICMNDKKNRMKLKIRLKEKRVMYEKRTDLAIEVKESFPQDGIEIDGVALKKADVDGLEITTVEIRNEQGAFQMKKPIGSYITIEMTELESSILDRKNGFVRQLSFVLEQMLKKTIGEKQSVFALLSGLGNRFATPDALGAYVLEKVSMNRHIKKEFMGVVPSEKVTICGLAPGVMSQTGMESSEILKGIIDKVQPDVLLVVDALASSSVNRLCRTIQITNTGISPGAGIGNNRNRIDQETMGIPVIAIGVPTVVDAGTIIYESLEHALAKEGYQEKEIYQFFQSVIENKWKDLFVTPKEIDEEVRQMSDIIAQGITAFVEGGK